MKREEYIKICPNCKSIDINLDKSTLQQTGALPSMYICNKCGHSGFIFPEIKVDELKKFEKEVDKKKLRRLKKDNSKMIDNSYGIFEVRFMWKITAPIFLILGLRVIYLDPISGIILTLLGVIMVYITYFEKKGLKD